MILPDQLLIMATGAGLGFLLFVIMAIVMWKVRADLRTDISAHKVQVEGKVLSPCAKQLIA